MSMIYYLLAIVAIVIGAVVFENRSKISLKRPDIMKIIVVLIILFFLGTALASLFE